MGSLELASTEIVRNMIKESLLVLLVAHSCSGLPVAQDNVDYNDYNVDYDAYNDEEFYDEIITTTTEAQGCGGFLCGSGPSSAFDDDETTAGGGTREITVRKMRKRRKCRTRYGLFNQPGSCWRVCVKSRRPL